MSEILKDFSESLAKTAIEANIFEHMLLFRYWDQAEIHDDPDMIWSITDIPFPRFNSILRAQISPDCIDATIEKAINRCRSKKVPMLWWTGPATRPADLDSYLMAHGFTQKGDQPGMAVDLFHLKEEPPVPPGLVIKEVLDRKTLQKWCDVFGAGFKIPGFARDAFFDFNSKTWFRSTNAFTELYWLVERRTCCHLITCLGRGSCGHPQCCHSSRCKAKGYRLCNDTQALARGACKGISDGCFVCIGNGGKRLSQNGF